MYRLDNALIRPGRIDVKQLITYCTQRQIERMFSRFFPLSSAYDASTFAKLLLEQSTCLSAAQVQGYLMFHKHDPQAAIDNVNSALKLV